ncbi:hypothetical protein JCM19000A_07140 [Silvimonas sp. JCM 19000]
MDGIDLRLASIDQRLSEVDRRFDKVDQRFDRLEDYMEKRFDRVDDRFIAIQHEIKSDFRILFGALITVALGLAGMIFQLTQLVHTLV